MENESTPSDEAVRDGPWPWWLAAGGLVAAIALGGWLWLRRRRAVDESEEGGQPDALVLDPSPPARALETPPPAIMPKTADNPDPGVTADFLPVALFADATQVVLEFELTIANAGDAAVEAIRPTIAITTAHPAIAAQLSGFGDSVPMSGSGDSFDLSPGDARRIVGELTLPASAMHVTTLSGRPMTVPVVILHLRWRAGLSVRSRVEGHIVGTGDGVGKLGPLWLDRVRTQTRKLAVKRI